MNNTIKKYIENAIDFIQTSLVIKILLLFVFCYSVFSFGKPIVNHLFSVDSTSNVEIMTVKEEVKDIIIPYKYTYNISKKIIHYERKDGKLTIKESEEQVRKKQYNKNLEKKDKLYDRIRLNKLDLSYQINLDKLNQYKFKEMVDIFPIAPYIDEEKNTLYIYSHSSGQRVNPGVEFAKMNVGDKLSLIDQDMSIFDEYEVISRDIYKEDDYNDNYLATYKDSVVLVTCRPIGSNKERVVTVLKKKK